VSKFFHFLGYFLLQKGENQDILKNEDSMVGSHKKAYTKNEYNLLFTPITIGIYEENGL